MSSLLVFNKVYRLEIQSVMLVFSTQVCELLPLYPLSGSPPPPPPPLPKVQRTVYTDRGSGWAGSVVGGGGVLSCVGDHILQEFNTLFLEPLQVNIF